MLRIALLIWGIILIALSIWGWIGFYSHIKNESAVNIATPLEFLSMDGD